MTHEPITTEAVRKHYDRLSYLYRTFWGDHIHHGYWNGSATANQAQIALMERLANRARVRTRTQVLDVGCGVGGPAIWLASKYQCSVLGLTISPVQLKIARKLAAQAGVAGRVNFRLEDANVLNYTEQFEVVWVIECSEHLFDKCGFIHRAAAALRPHGVLAVCAWLKSDNLESPDALRMVNDVCRGMLCPSLGTKSEYCAWMTDAGLELRTAEDITQAVSKTWDAGVEITRRPAVQQILRHRDSATVEFVRSFTAIAQAYAQGVMSYGMFTAVKHSK